MLKTLLKINFLSVISSLFKNKKNKKLSIGALIGMLLLGIYIFGIFGVMFTTLFSTLCEPFHLMGLDWFYFAMVGIVALALMFVGSVFAAQSQLYDAKDNELLLSLPIQPQNIVAGRMLMLLIINIVFELCVCIPAIAIYGITVGYSVIGVVALILFLLALPLFSLSLSALIGFVIQQISSRMRNKSAIIIILYIGFMLAYFYFYSQINSYLQFVVLQGQQLAASAQGIAPIFWLGNSIANGNILDCILFVAFCIIPFTIVYYLISKTFIKIATNKKGFARIIYKEQSLKTSSSFMALCRKELKHFVSSPMYMLNSAVGLLFLIIGGIMLIINKSYIELMSAQIPQLVPYIPAVLISVLCFCISMVIISSPSISLEGKNLWIAQSIPVDYNEVLMSKIWVHIVVSIPATTIASILILFAADFSMVMAIMAFVFPWIFTFFCADFGILMNLLFPKFDWVSETAAVKQSFSSIAAMLGTVGALLIPIFIYIFALNDIVDIQLYTVITTVFFGAVSIVLHKIITTWGKKRFAAL